jgi:hypothetical protein
VNFISIGRIQRVSVITERSGTKVRKKSFFEKEANETAIEAGTIEMKKEKKRTVNFLCSSLIKNLLFS